MIKNAIVNAIRNGKVVNIEYLGENVAQVAIKVPEIGLVEKKTLEDLKVLLSNKTKQGCEFEDNRIRVYAISDIYFDSNPKVENHKDWFNPENIRAIIKHFNTILVQYYIK